MGWSSEFKNYGVVAFADRYAKVYKSSNSFLVIDLGGGSVIQNALWAGDGVIITYTQYNKTRVRKYLSTSTFVCII
jgi:hypothetical protein